ncbi:MAG: MBL fold metallo-hydrolase [Acidobacteria bacterium]|nr:MBL fold metallo-hydrolase [Acidobacteriota bacterium]
MELAPGIHRIECPIGDRYIAVHVIVGTRHTAVIDTGYDESVRGAVVPYFRENGIDPAAVRYVIVTHADYDHSGGATAMRDVFPNSLVCAGERDRAMLEDLELMISDRYGEFAHTHNFDETEEGKHFIRAVAHSTTIDIGFTGGESLDLGDRTIEILHTPGHSWGHLSVVDKTTGFIVVGDAVLGDTVPLADGRPAFPPTYRYVEAYRATIRLLKGRRPVAILPAHYPAMFAESALDFLDLSLAYTDLVELVALETVTRSSRPISLLELIDKSHDRLGPWPSPACDYLVYAVLGHLEVLEQYHLVQSLIRSDGVQAWVAG